MAGRQTCDAIVVGGGINGLSAACYLAMAGKRVSVVEARPLLGGLNETTGLGRGFRHSRAAHLLYALDPRVVSELKLVRHGLKFAARDLPLVALRQDGKHLILSRDVYASARSIAAHSAEDSKAWPHFRRAWYERARRLRGLWQGAKAGRDFLASAACFARTSVAAWLDGSFESEALKATLAFDAHAMPPFAAGSALLVVWRAAQEMCGLQGAVAAASGGMRTVAEAFGAAGRDRGVEFRMEASVSDVLVERGAAQGVVLQSGEEIAAPLVLSSLSRRQTLSFPGVRAALDIGVRAQAEMEGAGVALARVTLAFDAQPVVSGCAVPLAARFVLADRFESLAAAHAVARAGSIPSELPMEAVIPTVFDPDLAPAGSHIVSVLTGPVPTAVLGGWNAQKPELAARAITMLARHMPGLSRRLVGVEVFTPDDAKAKFGAEDATGGSVDAVRLLADWRTRVSTPVAGLFLCGASAEPVGAVSGRAGRLAAVHAIKTATAAK